MTGSHPDVPPGEFEIMQRAAAQMSLDPSGARLVSQAARLIWHLPRLAIALTITRAYARTETQLLGETRAVEAAIEAGVRTPPVLAGPTALAHDRYALAFRWVEGQRGVAWPQLAEQAALLRNASTSGLPTLRMSIDVPRAQWAEVLGPLLAEKFAVAWDESEQNYERLTSDSQLVVSHGDLHPANVLVDRRSAAWLIDFEYASCAPAEWDPSKLLILSRRFRDPFRVGPLLRAWPQLDPERLAACASIQEALIVGWLVEMAHRGTAEAAGEARRRAQGLGGAAGPTWRHLS
jgi:aminoglycoside phosphotransferase (APT) family kinase protein